MRLSQRIFKNTSWLGISEFLIAGAGFVFTIFIGKALSIEEFGKFNYALTLVTTLGVFIELGLTKLTTREVSIHKNKASTYLTTSLVLRFIFALPALVILSLINTAADTDTTTKTISFILFAYILAFYVNHGFYSIYRAYEKINYEALSKCISGIILLAGGAFIFYGNESIFSAAYIYALSAILGGITNIALIKKLKIKKYKAPKKEFIKKTLREAWPFALSTIFVYIYYFVDTILLGIIIGNEAVAIYNIGYKVLFIAIIIIGFIYNGIFPIATKYAKLDLKLYYQIIERSYKAVMAFAILFAIMTYFYIDDGLMFVFGEKFNASIPYTQLLALNALFIAINILLGHLMLDIFKQQKKNTLATGIGAAINTALNIVLITYFEIYGAVIATIITEIVVMMLLFKMTKNTKKAKIGKNTSLLLLNGAIAFGLGIFYHAVLPPAISFILIPITFIATLYLSKVLNKKDVELISDLLNKN